jgi:hypothetical protein
MEKVTLTRHLVSNRGIIGYLHYKNKRIATTLENKWHHNFEKVSCIPEGEYICREDNTGKFQWWAVEGVIARENVEIHEGNKVDDTLGCILVGELDSETIRQGRLWISKSVATLKKLKKILPKEFKLIIE